MKKLLIQPKYSISGVVSRRKYEEYKEIKKKDLEKYPWFKSILVFAFPLSGEAVRNIRYLGARYTYGEDYHRVVSSELEKIAKELNLNKYKVFTDISILDEKICAYLAGLGWYGKNNLIITNEFGSNIAIGEIITDEEFEENTILMDSLCGDCRLCIDACPTKALTNPGFIKERCLSYLTQYISSDYELYNKVLKYAVGCDICQIVCPFNKVSYSYDNRFSFNDKSIITLDILSKRDNNSFLEYYDNKSFTWIGYLKMLRNILTLEVNNKNITSIELEKYQKKHRDVKWFYDHIEYLKTRVKENSYGNN